MRFRIERFGTSHQIPPRSPQEIQSNEFFTALSKLKPAQHGMSMTLPTGIPCRYVSHDLFGVGDQYLKDGGKWLYLPATTPEPFTGYNFWLSNAGQRLWIALYYGREQPQALLFEGTLLQLVLPPEGVKTPGFSDPMHVAMSDVIGVWAAERIDTVLSDDKSQAYIRVYTETERKPASKPDEPESVSEWLGLELGVPGLSHNLAINPTSNHFSAMFGF